MIVDIIDAVNGKSIKAHTVHADYKGDCLIGLIHVFDWYDQEETISSNCVIKMGVLETAPIHFEEGLYLLCYISLSDEETVLGRKKKGSYEIQRAFCVRDSIDLADSAAREIYSKVVSYRDTTFSKVKGDITNGTTLFDSYIFVKNLNVYSTIEYGDVSVIPYNKYKSLSESRLIDSFFTSDYVTFDYSSTLKEGYAAVLYIKNIMADEDGEYAKRYALEKASIIVNLFSISNHDNCQIIASVIKKKNDNLYSIHVIDPIYQGNLLRLADQGFGLRATYNYLSNNESNLKAYIKLFNEAVIEESIWASYFKFWVLLEVMAEAYGTKGKVMTAWDGTTIYEKDGKKEKVIATTFDSVMELMRIKYSHLYNRDFIKMPFINNVREFMSVCYKRRCCFAHNGVCNPNNHILCNQDAECVRCKSCMPRGNGRFDDPVWSRLEGLIRELIFFEIRECIGEAPRETIYINGLVDMELSRTT